MTKSQRKELQGLVDAARAVCNLSHAGFTWAQMSSELSQLWNAANTGQEIVYHAK